MAYEKSMITDDLEHCYFCGRTPVQFHHIYGGPNRKIATEDNMIVPLCLECHAKAHNDQRINRVLKQRGQIAYEDVYIQRAALLAREEFRNRYGKSYL